MSYRAVIVSVLLVLFAGCADVYQPPSAQHTYVTNTQAPHALTGLNIKTDYESEFATVYIDGRKIAKSGLFQGINTFVQLPPGEHLLHVGLSGFADNSAEFKFTLSEGQRGTFALDIGKWIAVTTTGSGLGSSLATFKHRTFTWENVDSYETDYIEWR